MSRTIRGLDAEQRRAERREQLLDAALTLFAANGYLNTSIEQICTTAYIGTKSFYELFSSREDCYVALLRRTSERLEARMAEAAKQANGNERQEAPRLLATFVHALVDDPRVTRVTFGMAAGISESAERERRTNRRWSAAFLEQLWDAYDGPPTDEQRPLRHSVAIGLVGGMFDQISDWLLDADLTNPKQVDVLIDDLTTFYITVRRGLTR
ncbi:TetR/AcrR family transcriptional regulator [Kribbella sandramycini]|uniref:AcrR family transcriptional regulator n=1 Tax=Kribbella sandramycini TaxID=60450 RepID=A0A7Y4P2U3_9ACTN|nr:TetR/AcrR family transcriptional regulator [Kribbella sandramycini]MBB6567230.1 AcrR family transcriptional regulator [Kribbella sandramycini]NOL45767.1 TetR/AcrR family transcriptional regulator [Kribbella sandramycini]